MVPIFEERSECVFSPSISDVDSCRTFHRLKSYDSLARAGAASRYLPRHRVAHLDLKGAPPRVDYLGELFGLMREAGATAVLLEWEDMFPYRGRLANISSRTAYTEQAGHNTHFTK